MVATGVGAPGYQPDDLCLHAEPCFIFKLDTLTQFIQSPQQCDKRLCWCAPICVKTAVMQTSAQNTRSMYFIYMYTTYTHVQEHFSGSE